MPRKRCKLCRTRRRSGDIERKAGTYYEKELQDRCRLRKLRKPHGKVTELENQDSSKKKIPIKDAYYQLINNNVLSLKHMESEEAGAIEQQIHQKFLSSREQIMKELESQLYNPNAPSMAELVWEFLRHYSRDTETGALRDDRKS